MFPSASNEFPALNRLELDFTDWQLSASDAIRVRRLFRGIWWSLVCWWTLMKGRIDRSVHQEVWSFRWAPRTCNQGDEERGEHSGVPAWAAEIRWFFHGQDLGAEDGV